LVGVLFICGFVPYFYDKVANMNCRLFKGFLTGSLLVCFGFACMPILERKAVAFAKGDVWDWDRVYKIPIDSERIGERGIVNLGRETQNFALSGRSLENRVFTTMEVIVWYYGGHVSYRESRKLPAISQQRMRELKEVSGCQYLYSEQPIPYDSLRLIGSCEEKFPTRTGWLKCYVYEFK